MFGQICDFCVKKNGFQKLLQKKVPLQSQTVPYSNARRLPERQPHVRAVQTKTVARATVEALFEIFAEKNDWAENWCEQMTGLLNCSQKTEWTVDFCCKLRQV